MESMAARNQPNIPTVDMREAQSDPEAFARAIGAAFTEVGFVGLTHHGVDAALVERAYAVYRQFFALPTQAKMRSHLAGKGGARGYTPFGVEHAKDAKTVDLKEFWQIGRELPEGHALAGSYPRNPWPDELAPGFSEVSIGLFDALERAGNVVLRGVARHLALPPAWFADKVDIGNNIVRAIHYPPIEGEPEGVRSAAHEDINVITLLVGSGEPGLEILNKAGEWLPVSTIPGTIVCNVGDMLQRLTNRRLISTTHRVRNPPEPWRGKSRFSIPFFLHFNSDFVIQALPQCIGPDGFVHEPEPINADDYLKLRLREIGLLAEEN